MKTLTVALLTVGALCAQNSIEGPAVGWVFDRVQGGVRPVLGIPGASSMGGMLEIGVELKDAAVAAGGQYALAVTREGQAVVVDLRRGQVSGLDVAAGADGIVLSPEGKAGLVVYREAGKVVWIEGLPGVEKRKEIEVRGERLAVSDDGRALLAVEGGKGTVVDRDGNRWVLGMEVRAASFVPGGTDVLVSNGDGVSLVKDVMGNATATTMWTGEAVAFAMTKAGRVLVIDSENRIHNSVGGNEWKSANCPCAAGQLTAMGEAVYRVNELGDGPLWLVDAGGSEVRTVFVPAEVTTEQ